MDFCKAGRRPVKCFLKKLILTAERERVSIINISFIRLNEIAPR